MRTLHCPSLALSALLLAAMAPGTVMAGDSDYSVQQSQTGMNLPGVSVPSGFDEVRAADGTTCRSSVAGTGAYMDSGLVGGPGGSSSVISAYGRIVVPLGRNPPRLDCHRLYQLELERLQLEVQLLKRGLDPRMSNPLPGEADWAQEGWTTEGRQ